MLMLQRMAGLRNIEKLFDFDDTDDSGSSVSENESSEDETDIDTYINAYNRPDKNLSWRQYIMYILYHPSYLITSFLFSMDEYTSRGFYHI